MFIQIIKNILLDTDILVIWTNQFLRFYRYGFILLLLFLIIYGVKLYIFREKDEHPDMNSILNSPNTSTISRKYFFISIKNIYNVLFKYRGKYLYKFIRFRRIVKEMITGLLVMFFGRIIVSGVFSIHNMSEKEIQITDYRSQKEIKMYNGLIDKGVMTSITSYDNELIMIYLFRFTIYLLVIVILGAFFYTFSLGNKFVENIAILMRILSILLFFFSSLINLYQKYAL